MVNFEDDNAREAPPDAPDWDDEQVRESRVFRTTIQLTNLRGLIFCGGIVLACYPVFWFLDLYITPRWTQETLILRVLVSLFALVLFVGALMDFSWIRERTGFLGALLMLFAGGGIAVMCWMGGGLESKYYAGLTLVFMATVIFFTFTRAVTYGLIWGVYGAYIVPWFVRGMPVNEVAVLTNNQFFLFGGLIICTLGYHFRFQLVMEEARRRLEQREMMRKFRRMARYDNLTGLKNRGSWLEDMGVGESEGETAPAKRDEGTRGWIIMIDVDHFKNVNDRYGHQAGDYVLCRLAEIFEQQLRPGDSIARFGGEEFIVELDPEALEGGANAHTVADRLRQVVEDTEFTFEGAQIPLTISMGLASWPYGTLLEDVISEADEALYEAKENGRNRVVSYGDRGGSRTRKPIQ